MLEARRQYIDMGHTAAADKQESQASAGRGVELRKTLSGHRPLVGSYVGIHSPAPVHDLREAGRGVYEHMGAGYMPTANIRLRRASATGGPMDVERAARRTTSTTAATVRCGPTCCRPAQRPPRPRAAGLDAFREPVQRTLHLGWKIK